MSKMSLRALSIAIVLGGATPCFSQAGSPPAAPNAGHAANGATEQDYGYPTKDGGFYKYQGPQDSPPRSDFYGRT